MRKGAEFSPDERHRYAFWRSWNEDLPPIMYIGLNPSVGGKHNEDKTLRRLMRFTADHLYGGFYIVNLFCVGCHESYGLRKAADHVGDNDRWLTQTSGKCQDVCYMWGAFPGALVRAKIVKTIFPNALCLGKTLVGHPAQPLYLAAETQMLPYI